jgi:hypothetical protein
MLVFLIAACGTRSQVDTAVGGTPAASSDQADLDSLKPVQPPTAPGLTPQDVAQPYAELAVLRDCTELTNEVVSAHGKAPERLPFGITNPPSGSVRCIFNDDVTPQAGRSDAIARDGRFTISVLYLPKGVDPNRQSAYALRDAGAVWVGVTFNARPAPFPPDDANESCGCRRRVDLPDAVDEQGAPSRGLVYPSYTRFNTVAWDVRGGGGPGIEHIEIIGNYAPSQLVAWARSAFRTEDGVSPAS